MARILTPFRRNATVPSKHWKLPVVVLLSAYSLLYTSTAYAGAWAQEDRGLYMQLTLGAETASKQYKETGGTFQLLSEDDKGSFWSYSSSLYAEFGLLPKLTLVGSTDFRQVTLDSTEVHSIARGFGDFRLGARYQILGGPLVTSIYLGAKFPTGYTPDPPELRAATLGNGVNEYEARLLLGHSFYPLPIYASGEVGYRLRGSRKTGADAQINYPAEIPYFLEVGYAPVDWIWLRGVVDGVYGLGSPVAIEGISLTPLTQSYTKVGPSVIFKVMDDYAIQLNYSYTLMGVNALQSHQVSIGFAIDTTLGQSK